MKPNQGRRIFADLEQELGVFREREREMGADTMGETRDWKGQETWWVRV
jgi:hypothetical protein